MERNIWLDGMMGLVVGDALGCPVQFMSREEIADRPQGPVTGMEGYGTYDMPEGTWTDDSSMALAALDSILELGKVDLTDIMKRFVEWYERGEYTPFGESFDIGNTCSLAIDRFEKEHDITSCGGRGERSNGNGSLMRIMPACLYAYDRGLSPEDAVGTVHDVSSLTHAHQRSKIACGLYYFCVKSVLDGDGLPEKRLQDGLDLGFTFYGRDIACRVELAHYGRLRNLEEFKTVPVSGIRSSGYVVDSLEAAIWCLITTESFRECLLKAVNLGDDTDTIGAIAGGLAALYYGYDSIPEEWITVIQRRDMIEEMCTPTGSVD